jgi:hypothetical protein
LIDLQRQLSTERELRAQIQVKLQDAKRDLIRGSPKTAVNDILDLAEPADLSVGAAEFRSILDGAIAFEKAIGTAEAQLKVGLSGLEGIIARSSQTKRRRKPEAQKKIDAKRRELEALIRALCFPRSEVWLNLPGSSDRSAVGASLRNDQRESTTTSVAAPWGECGRVAQSAERVCEQHETVVRIHSPAANS